MHHLIQKFNKEQIQDKKAPDFTPGDTVVVQVKVREGERERLQAFEGVVIAIHQRGLNSARIVVVYTSVLSFQSGRQAHKKPVPKG